MAKLLFLAKNPVEATKSETEMMARMAVNRASFVAVTPIIQASKKTARPL